MGQTWSSSPNGTQDSDDRYAENVKHMYGLLSPFQRLSLKRNLERIGDNPDELLKFLGIYGLPGSDVVLRIAHNLTGGVLHDRIVLVIGWLDGSLASSLGTSEYEWRKTIFNAASSSQIGDEHYISFDDLSKLVALLMSAFDWDPRDFQQKQLQLIKPANIAHQILKDVKEPAICFDQFNSKVLETFPYLLKPIANIWDRLLNDEASMAQTADQQSIVPSVIPISRDQMALIYINVGPRIMNSFNLFQGTKDGFSMQAFETGVTKWPSASVLVVTGRQPKNLEKNWLPKAKSLDDLVPSLYDAPLKPASHLMFAIYMDEPWKVSRKHAFGKTNCLLLQLEPEFHLWKLPAESIVLDPSKGLGAGFKRPPSARDKLAETVLFIDNTMEHAVLRHSPLYGRKFEHRFFVKEILTLGCGTASDLQRQKRAWQWENQEAQRRKNVNVHEDRAILEMAGLVGQYN